jgi:hypothetical protein
MDKRGEEENFEFLAAQDPLMAGFQDVIKQQLRETE